MFAYEVWVKSPLYHGKFPLTYTSLQKLTLGTVVKVDLKKIPVFGIIRRETSAPKGIAMKPISKVFSPQKCFVPKEHLSLLSWLLQYYPSGSGQITSLFLPSYWPKEEHSTIKLPRVNALKLPPLTADQKKALTNIKKSHGTTLLHGDTGTGKTRIYIERIKTTLQNNKSSLILVPEIGLTPHIYKQISNALPNITITLFHSGMSAKKRGQAWLEISQANQPVIVIGPRSALFLPLHNLGLIIVDECHDNSYKQSNSPPYHALRVASKLAQLHNADLIFGSATPTVSDIYTAISKKIPISRMTKPANSQKNYSTEQIIIDKRNKSNFSYSKYISNQLIQAIKNQLTKNKQSLLFLNRRGSARIIACQECGWQAICPNCELSLTLHEDIYKLRCHTCGFITQPSTNCPDCNNTDIVYNGPGTKAIQKEINRLFPNAHNERFDSDNLTNEKLDKKFDLIESGKINILIGTQVLIKGFDITNLGLVGLIDADTSLTFPDYSTEEKTYQLINQAIGRVGRGHANSTIIVQTLYPNSILLKQALSSDWDNFYQTQLTNRANHNYPPYTFLLKLICERKSRLTANNAATKLKASLTNEFPQIEILGPTPSFKEKRNNKYCWQLIIKSNRRSSLLNIITSLPSGWKYDIDPIHLL